MTDREVMQQALEALENIYLTLPPESVLAKSLNHRTTALKDALEQQQAEPVQKPKYMAKSNGRHSPLLTHMMNKRTALEQQAEPMAAAVYETIIQWDEGGGKRSRRELARRIVELYTTPPQRKPLTEEEIEQAYRHIYSNVPDGSYRTTYYWIEQGIRYAEQAHGIGEKHE